MADATKTAEQQAADAAKAAEAQKTAEVKELLKRYGLKQAAVDEKGEVHFDAAYIKKLDEKTLTIITA